MSTAIYWFTLDLRLHDLPGLAAAMRQHDQVLPIFILDPSDPWFFGGASQWWLHHSLASLQQSLREIGGSLVLRSGKAVRLLPDLVRTVGADTVYFSRAYEPWLAQTQLEIFQQLTEAGVECKRYSGRLLLEPDQVLNRQGKPFQVFTPFYRHCLNLLSVSADPPPDFRWYRKKLPSEKLSDWNLLPKKPNWARGFNQWQPGEAGAEAQLRETLAQRLVDYAHDRDLPGVEGTSFLSPHLHFGEISPRRLWRDISGGAPAGIAETYLRQLMWREFSHYLLHHWPQTPTAPFRAHFAEFSWRHDPVGLRAWQRGLTGYPLVDAGMRQLWQTGWMHNRVRMIVASFLTKHLRIHWLTGAKWFWDTLVDADLANNTAGWQWVAGCGADAAPYFRIFNPVLQSEKFDRDGEYIRRWVPELKRLPSRHIHQPWRAPAAVLQEANVQLGDNYPKPIIEHEGARAAALAAYAGIKRGAGN